MSEGREEIINFFGERIAKCMESQTNTLSLGAFFPPPWRMDEHPKKTLGWIAFQEEFLKNIEMQKYFLSRIISE